MQLFRFSVRLLLWLLLPLACFAQSNEVRFTPVNTRTQSVLDSVVCVLSRGDVEIARDTIHRPRFSREYVMSYPQGPGKFALEISSPNYYDAMRTFTVTKNTREHSVNLGNVMMIPGETRHLKEISVTATKIKMVMRGDTIVYNADAFALSSGSLLDELVSQLPGAKLMPGGRITVNDTVVSALLVNGRNFFKGDPTIALRNLPAYTVNEVKVYHRERDDMIKAGAPPVERRDLPLVMDVHLKKQYQVGWLFNVEGGYGLEDRFRGRLFGLGFTRTVQIAMFGNINNVNDFSTVSANGEYTDWRSGYRSSSGISQVKAGGLSANWQLMQEGRTQRFDGSVTVNDDRNSRQSGNSRTEFYVGGDEYSKDRQSSVGHTTDVNVQTSYSLNARTWFVGADGYYTYQRNKSSGFGASAYFSTMPAESSRGAVLDSIFSGNASQHLRDLIVRTQQNRRLRSSESNRGKLMLKYNVRQLSLSASGDYDRGTESNENLYDLKYADADVPSRFERRWNPSESHTARASFSAKYDFWAGAESALRNWRFTPGYDFGLSDSHTDAPEYRLDRLEGWGEDSSLPLGMTPSAQAQLAQALDPRNSYETSLRQLSHTFWLDARYDVNWHDRTEQLHAGVSLSEDYNDDRLRYIQPRLSDQTVERRRWSLRPRADASLRVERESATYSLSANWSHRMRSPRLYDLLDRNIDPSPLMVIIGNPDLRDGSSDNVSLNFGVSPKKHGSISLNMDYGVEHNAVADERYYDRSTGVTTSRSVNVEGNWNASASLRYSRMLRKVNFSASLECRYRNSVDLTSEAGAPERSLVRNWNCAGRFSANWSFCDYRNSLSVELNPVYTRQTSDRLNFANTTAWDLNYRVNLTVRTLPWLLQLTTTFMARTRLGYNLSGMNSTELIWNAELSRRFKKITVTIEGYDILHNIRNYNRVLNAQGIYESWSNNLPSYVMLRLSWRFELFPKHRF